MTFTFSSLITALLFSTMSISLLCFILKSNLIIKKTGLRILFISVFISILHLVMPFEYSFTKAVPITKIWPQIILFFNKDIFVFSNMSLNLIVVFYTIWLIGTIYVFAKKTFAYLHMMKKVKKFDKADSNLNRILETITAEHKIKNRFILVTCKTVTVPMILGLVTPIIIIPEVELTEKEWRFIISHEIAHYKNGDTLVKFLLEFFIAVYWWNPFVYLLKKQVLRLLELNVDTYISKSWKDDEKIEYVEFLVKLTKKQYGFPKNNWSAAFASDAISVTQRANILIGTNEKQSIIATIIVFCISFIIMFMPVFFIFEPYYILPEHAEDTHEFSYENIYYIKNADGTYDLYMDGEYMITQEEAVDNQIKIYENPKEAPQ